MIRFKKSYLFFVAVLVCGVGILGSMTGVAKADVTSTSISTPTFRIMTQSDSGDYIGQNKSWDFSSSNNSKITISQASNSTVSFNASSFSISNMSFGFAAESGKTLSPGLHTPAKRLPFRDFFNGIDIGGDGRGCNTILGAFYVHEYVMNNGVLQKAAIDFVQICGPKSTDINAVVPKLYGSLRYNSTIPDSCNSQGCADVKKNVGITVVPVKPDLIISDIKIEKREGDSWKYIYVTVKNNGGDALPFNQIMGITIKDLDTGKIYGSGLTDRIIVGYNKDVSSADPIVEKSSGIYNLEATVDTKIEKSSGTYTDAYNESNENNNTFTKTITISNSNKPDLKIDGVSVMPIRDNPNAKDIGVYFNRLSSQDFKQYRIKLYDKTSGYTDYKTVISYAQGNVDFFLNPGKYNLLFTIDNDNVIDESNENDNTFTKTVVVAEQAPAKTCLELENIQQKYFNICRDNGFFSDVCFNKFSGEYQGCGKSLKNDCTENNLNADKNIRCSIPMQGLEFQWYVIPSSYYNVTPDGISNGIMGEYGMQGRINETCSNICAAKNLKAEPKCAGWNDIKNACRKTGTINNLMSAGSSCNEINSNSQTGLDYCCCGNSVNNDINISSCVKEGESLTNASQCCAGLTPYDQLYSVGMTKICKKISDVCVKEGESLTNASQCCAGLTPYDQLYSVGMTKICKKISDVCVKENESLGAVVPGNNKQCCAGLRSYIQPGIIGTRGICKKIEIYFPQPIKIDPQITQINTNANQLHNNQFDEILSELKQLRDRIKEQASEIRYLKKLTVGVKELAQGAKDAINNFITYGVDKNTQKLGAGERAAVINSYKSAFDKLPETEAELIDAIKIANGRFPNVTSDKAEKKAKEQFIKIYKKIADMNDANDSAAIKVMAYGLRQKAENRSLDSEKTGIKTFKGIFKHNPSTTEDWNTMQAITYSGASREKDSDRDLLPDDREKELGTNPLKADTDGDGFKDGEEVASGHDPLKK